MSLSERFKQVERDFGQPSPHKVLAAGLRRRDTREVTPLQRSIAQERIAELSYLERRDGLIVLLMRGARIEVLAAAISDPKDAGVSVGAIVKAVRQRIPQADLDSLLHFAVKTVRVGR